MPGRYCRVCSRPDLAAIDAAVQARESHRAIATRFDLSRFALMRHVKNGHVLPPETDDEREERLALELAAKARSVSGRSVDRANEVALLYGLLAKRRMHEGVERAAQTWAGLHLKAVELRARLAGEFEQPAPVVGVTIQSILAANFGAGDVLVDPEARAAADERDRLYREKFERAVAAEVERRIAGAAEVERRMAAMAPPALPPRIVITEPSWRETVGVAEAASEAPPEPDGSDPAGEPVADQEQPQKPVTYVPWDEGVTWGGHGHPFIEQEEP